MKAKKSLCVTCNSAFKLLKTRVIVRLHCVKTHVIARVYCSKTCVKKRVHCVKSRVIIRLQTHLHTYRRAFTRDLTRFLLRIPTTQVALFVSKSISLNTVFLPQSSTFNAPEPPSSNQPPPT